MNTLIRSILSVLTVALIATTSDGKNLRATNNVGNVEYGATEKFQGYVQTMKNQKEHNIMNSRGGKAQDYNDEDFADVDEGEESSDTDGCRAAGDWILKSKCEDCCTGYCARERWGGMFGEC